ncbi:hypothetical protein ACFLT2_11575 [Acidobacteriota bacterium]
MKKENVRKYVGLMNDEIKAMEKDFNYESVRESWAKGKWTLLRPGNSKIDKGVLTFNLPPVITCKNCSGCWADCYAVKALMRTNVRKAWARNYILARDYTSIFMAMLINELHQYANKHKGQKLAVRIHSSGDMFDQDYLGIWADLARVYLNIQFFTYSKVKGILDFSQVDAMANFNVIDSLIDGRVNFGSMDYCLEMVKKHNAFLCPCYQDRDGFKVKCGLDCTYCIKGNKPVFKVH